MLYTGKLESKQNHTLNIRVEATDIIEAEKKILERFDNMTEYQFYEYTLKEVISD